jgi:hypothetical protein
LALASGAVSAQNGARGRGGRDLGAEWTDHMSMDETPHPAEQPISNEDVVVVQTIQETHGWPARLTDEELPPPSPLPLLTVGKLIVLPCCEMLSWPRMILRDAIGRRRGTGA